MEVELRLDAAPGRAADRARELVGLGAAGLFTFEGPHDVFFPLVEAAGATRARLMTNIAVAFPRNPIHLAHAAYDLHLASGGRFVLGLGSQVRAHIERRFGLTWSRPAARMADTVRAVKAILASWQDGTPLHYDGEFTRHTLMPPMFRPPPLPYGPPPVLMGALGPLMTRTATAVADGLLVMPFASTGYFRDTTLRQVHDGLARAGRELDGFTVVGQAIVGMWDTDSERSAALAGARALVAFYASTPAYLPVLETEGYAELFPELNRRSKAGAPEALTELVDERMAGRFAVLGTPEQCAAQIVERFGGVGDRVCAYFPGYDPTHAQVARLITALREHR